MKTYLRTVAALVLLVAASAAQAAITCSVSSGGVAAAYDPTSAAPNVTQSFFTVTCTRGLASDPTTVDFSVRADNGLNAQGQNNRASMGGSFLRYDVFRDPGCSSKWKGGTAITGTVSLPTTGTFSAQGVYWGCIAAGLAPAAGTYVDTVTMTMSYGAAPVSAATGSFGVSIFTPATCTISSAPGPLVFDYSAFGPAIAPSVAFGVTCTNALPYTLSLDAPGGTLVGLNYGIALSATSGVGIGAQQNLSIVGSMAAGQPGICTGAVCSGSAVHTLTITY